MAKRLGVGVAVLLVAVDLAAGVFNRPASARSRSVLCGVDRWTIKTLQDRPRLLPMKRTTIAYLVSRPAPTRRPRTRLPFERHIFRVTAAVTHVDPQIDQDLHVILSDGQHTMTTEAPATDCTKDAKPVRRVQMAQARRKVEVCAKAVVTGVAFFDTDHGQNYVAPNAIELHPILGFTCLVKSLALSPRAARRDH
jgi:hypothetical protein